MAGRTGALVALAIALGSIAGFVWVRVVTPPAYVVQPDGHATIAQRDLGTIVAADAVFVILGLVGGLVLGVFAWLWFRRHGFVSGLAAVGAGLLAGMTCWTVGGLLEPPPFVERLAQAQPGEVVPLDVTLHAPSALAVWAFAAVAVPLFAASVGPDWRVAEDEPAVPAAEGATR